MKFSDYAEVCDRLGIDRNSPECRAIKELDVAREDLQELIGRVKEVRGYLAEEREDKLVPIQKEYTRPVLQIQHTLNLLGFAEDDLREGYKSLENRAKK